jgi:DNA-directed RNA polymerase subunit RPC12/RpoP
MSHAAKPQLNFNESFQFELKELDKTTVVNLIGVIDEDSDFSPLLKIQNPINFNFKKVTAINSCGIRSWVNFMKDCSSVNIEFSECPPLVVRQMNMVPSFIGKASVTSVYIPYVCDNCENEQNKLIQLSDFKKGTPVTETINCEKCGSTEMEIDGNVKQYFAFAK